MIAFINASPLIYLAKIGAINYLPKLFTECITTKAVKLEVLKQKDAPEYIILEESFEKWLNLKEPSNKNFIKKLEQLLIHHGEASIIAIAKEFQKKSETRVLIIDDLAAREIARTLGLNITGSLGIILKALKTNLINMAKSKELLKTLVTETSFRISTPLYVKTLEEIDVLGVNK
jgi:predicted nucleic acid-binding protein